MKVSVEVHGRDSTTEADVEEIERITRHAERPGRPESDQPSPTEQFRLVCEPVTVGAPAVGESVGIHVTAKGIDIAGEVESIEHFVYGRVEASGGRLTVVTYERDQGGDEILNALARGALPVMNDADERGAEA